VSNNLLKYKG